jgi:hypothetical protein
MHSASFGDGVMITGCFLFNFNELDLERGRNGLWGAMINEPFDRPSLTIGPDEWAMQVS